MKRIILFIENREGLLAYLVCNQIKSKNGLLMNKDFSDDT